MRFQEYYGLNYDQASLAGYQLVRQAAKDGDWVKVMDRLNELRQIMSLSFDRSL